MTHLTRYVIVGRLQRTLIATRQTWTDFILIA